MPEPRPTLRERWAARQTTLNGWLSIPSSLSAEVMAVRGFDSVTVDMQHGLIGYDTAFAMIGAGQLSGIPSLVRVPWTDLSGAMRVLDAGSDGVILPLVNTPADAAEFVAACRFPPLGVRSVGPTRVGLYQPDYLAEANRRVLLLAQIETEEAVRNIDAICATEGLDGVYVGPADLNASRGAAPVLDSTDADLLKTLERIATSARAAGIASGIHCGSVEYAHRMADLGYDMVTVQSDVRILGAGAAAVVDGFSGNTDPT